MSISCSPFPLPHWASLSVSLLTPTPAISPKPGNLLEMLIGTCSCPDLLPSNLLLTRLPPDSNTSQAGKTSLLPNPHLLTWKQGGVLNLGSVNALKLNTNVNWREAAQLSTFSKERRPRNWTLLWITKLSRIHFCKYMPSQDILQALTALKQLQHKQ